MTETQRKVIAQLEHGPLTDKVLAGRLQTTLHGIRACLNAMMAKGTVKRGRKNEDGTYQYEVKL